MKFRKRLTTAVIAGITILSIIPVAAISVSDPIIDNISDSNQKAPANSTISVLELVNNDELMDCVNSKEQSKITITKEIERMSKAKQEAIREQKQKKQKAIEEQKKKQEEKISSNKDNNEDIEESEDSNNDSENDSSYSSNDDYSDDSNSNDSNSSVGTTTQTEALYSIDNPDPNYHGTVINLSDSDRNALRSVIMGEAGGEGYVGACILAQTIRDNWLAGGYSSAQDVISGCQYYGWMDSTNDDVENAISFIFDQGGVAVQHRIRYMYATSMCYSSWHETQNYILTYGSVKYFDSWD